MRKEGDDFDENTSLAKLIDDMFETMYAASGVVLQDLKLESVKEFIVDGSPFAEPDESKEIDDDLLILKKFKSFL